LLILSLVGAAYLALAFVRVLAFSARKPGGIDDELLPSVTILKPVAGSESQLYENLASCCRQDYPDYEVVLCFHSAGDPAIAVADRLKADFPQAKIRVAVGDNPAMANPKIANLAKPGAEPNGEIVVIADSDVFVTPEYLRAVAGEFATENTGATTCLYGGLTNPSIVSRLGAMHLEDEFAPSVLVALALGPLRFCLGATMAVRRSVLAAIGGLEALGPFLADDHTLGELVTGKGYTVTLCPYAVKTLVPETHLGELWSHELRWARTHRAHAPAGYFFSFVMYALPIAAIYAAVVRSPLAIAVFCAVAALRLAVHASARNALRVKRGTDSWLIPFRDVLSLGIWFVSLFGRSVRWRDTRSTVTNDGRLAQF
jgi:ceramide glucosyltransferase